MRKFMYSVQMIYSDCSSAMFIKKVRTNRNQNIKLVLVICRIWLHVVQAMCRTKRKHLSTMQENIGPNILDKNGKSPRYNQIYAQVL